MSSEFENLEIYVQSKLYEERKYYEKQWKTSESKFKNLEVKWKEYEDLLLVAENKQKDSQSSMKIGAWRTKQFNKILNQEYLCEEELSVACKLSLFSCDEQLKK